MFSNWNFNDYSQSFHKFDLKLNQKTCNWEIGLNLMEKFKNTFRKVLENEQQFKKFWFNSQTFVHSRDEYYSIEM